MRDFCWHCHRTSERCFCASALPFASSALFALMVHPYEVKSTVGTAWILRRSISNLKWLRSNGIDFDRDEALGDALATPEAAPLLLFPGPGSLNLNRASDEEWRKLVPGSKRPLLFVVDGTWTQAKAMLRKSAILRALPRVSFEQAGLSEYGFKHQPNPACLSSVESVHRVIDILAERGWSEPPPRREHDRMLEIFRAMVEYQLRQAGGLRLDERVLRRRGYVPLPHLSPRS